MFSFKKIMPHVYHVDFDKQYDLAMAFIRFQEYYESPKWYRKFFKLADYMEWYAEKHGKGAFTYPADWSGFNVPSSTLRPVRNWLTQVACQDRTRQEDLMINLVDIALHKEGTDDFYFVGTFGNGSKCSEDGDEDILAHELAHALYFVDRKYRARVQMLVREWNGTADWKNFTIWNGCTLDSARDVLRGMGYHDSVIDDEVNAYSSTGLCKELQGVLSESETAPFKKLYQETLAGRGA